MARLPFGQNPFADFLPTPSATINPHSTASFLSRQTFPPPITDKRDKFHQKRKYAGDVSKQHPKRNKTIMVEDVAHAESASSYFGSLILENYSENDVKIWKNRSDSDADFNFKLGLSDTFYYDLNNATIKDQDSEISKYKDDIPILKGQVTD